MTGFIRKTIGSITGSTAAGEAAERGAATAAGAQRESLDYLKEREALPQQYREAGLGQLAGIYGMEGGDPDALARLERSPIYQAIMSSADIGEESVLATAGKRGMTRSGDVVADLSDYNAKLKQQALFGGLQGIQGMAQLPSMAPQIAQGISGIGQTLSQGQIAKAQAQQAGMGMALTAGAAAFSDSRLKINVEAKGKRNGHEWFTWIWNKRAEALGLVGRGEGVIADKVEKYMPEAIKLHEGFKTVDYDMLGV
jgi:hypothetical protein